MANSPGMLEDHAEFVFALVGSGASYPTIAKQLLAEHNVKTSGRNISSWAQRRLKKIAARRELLAPMYAPLQAAAPIAIAPELVPAAANPPAPRAAAAPVKPVAAAPAQPIHHTEPVVATQLGTPVPMVMTAAERDAKFAELTKMAEMAEMAEQRNRLILPTKAKPAQPPTSPPPAVL